VRPGETTISVPDARRHRRCVQPQPLGEGGRGRDDQIDATGKRQHLVVVGLAIDGLDLDEPIGGAQPSGKMLGPRLAQVLFRAQHLAVEVGRFEVPAVGKHNASDARLGQR
jgi:hypothetical protein